MCSLADRFERVCLVDMFHMPRVRAEAENYFNVKLLSGDITGIFAMMKDGKHPGGSMSVPTARIPHHSDVDLVASANCLKSLAPSLRTPNVLPFLATVPSSVNCFCPD
ncbi:MAG: hypothetical protein P8L79_02995 [Rhodospirillaceae bacterium]|nr:hypothetical protein [Rhodospirillaceae bacterium]